MIFENNEVLGSYNGKVIIQNELGVLFYFESEAYFLPGSVVENELLKPILELSEEEQEEIGQIFL